MEEIFEVLEVSNFILLAIALGLNIYVVKSFGHGMLNVVFASLGFSIFFLLAYFVFHDLAGGDSDFYAFSDGTKHIWSHAIVYLSMISIIWGGYRIKSIVSSGDVNEMSGFNIKDKLFFSVLMLILFFIFTLSPVLESVWAGTALVAIIDSWGLHHFAVFVLGAISAWYLLFIKGNWGLLSKSIGALIGFLVLIGLQHFWETFTESWKIVEPAEVIIEGVELALIAPALVLLCVAQWKIIKFIKG